MKSIDAKGVSVRHIWLDVLVQLVESCKKHAKGEERHAGWHKGCIKAEGDMYTRSATCTRTLLQGAENKI